MKKNILDKINDALLSDEISDETKVLLIDVKRNLKQAKTEKRITQIVAVLIKIITGFFDDD
ncbi:hypothetical protein [Winogradskyella forsetii]|uniref:hypothetical protein n=1 Tax=Winogradskyella forsetii TaxID=2686077 RepID=UPI0015BC2E15|nr:hypothetical protein [Winogradskyella forsetii]